MAWALRRAGHPAGLRSGVPVARGSKGKAWRLRSRETGPMTHEGSQA
jgi:hypothetical protein